MTSEELLHQALPGAEATVNKKQKPWRGLAEHPWKVWDSNLKQWAIYQVIGDRLGETSRNALKQAHQSGIATAIIAADHSAIEAVAPHFMELNAHVICPIAGRAHLINRSGISSRRRAGAALAQETRIPRGLLKLLAPLVDKHPTLSRRFTPLFKSYQGKAQLTDDKEQVLLANYGTSILKKIGFSGHEVDAAAMIRKLEKASWGGARDHFFHSFQNYFFGLYAVLSLPQLFQAYDTVRRMHWQIDSFDIWLLTTLWHDVGYGIEKSGNILEDIYGNDLGETLADNNRETFLGEPIVVRGISEIACTICHLLSTVRPAATWMLPTEKHRRTPNEMRIERALRKNVKESSHGAASALRMYSECMPKISRLNNARQHRPRQALMLACASAPFHDWHFRQCVREEMGVCAVPTNALPFASLLAFVDSIQDDRRDISTLQSEVCFLESILIREAKIVSAKVNSAALKNESLLWKIIEARDVKASLRYADGGPDFEYPSWMATA